MLHLAERLHEDDLITSRALALANFSALARVVMRASSVRRAIGTVWSSAAFCLRLAAGAEGEGQSGRYLVDTWRACIVKQAAGA